MMIGILSRSALALFIATCAWTSVYAWEIPTDVKTLPVNGYPMAYVEQGAGDVAILVHGTVSDYRDWQNQVTAFASQYRVIAPSLRHYFPERWDGQSNTLTMRQHVADLAAFIRGLAVGRVRLVGFSRGGQVALLMASEHI